MKNVLLMLMWAVLCSCAVGAEESVTVPLGEFKKLYRQSVEEELAVKNPEKEHGASAKKSQSMVCTIDEARYNVRINDLNAQCEVALTGRLISGDPSSVPLFGKDLVIARTGKITGGTLLSSSDGVGFMPSSDKKEFSVSLTFLVPLQEDSRSGLISFGIPNALRNSLCLKFPEETKLVQQPGMKDDEGMYQFPASDVVLVRFLRKSAVTAVSLVDIDILSDVKLQGKRAIVTSYITPVQSWPPIFTLNVPSNASFTASSLKSSWLKGKASGQYEVNIPADAKGPMYIQFAVEESVAGRFLIGLPQIHANSGKEGDFVIEEPDDGQIEMASSGLVKDIPVNKLNSQLIGCVQGHRSYSHISSSDPINVNIRRFKSVSTPSIVLDSQSFYASFEENGNLLSMLELDVPPEVGARMAVKVIPETEVWSLTVNGKKRKVYANEQNEWVIPLQESEVSHVELALLRKCSKMGLQGRLEAVMPATGMASRTVKVGVALPERVDLLSLEGPLNSASGGGEKLPVEFIGKPYHFSRAFYEGQGLSFAVSYKEPINKKLAVNGGVK